MRLAQTAYNQNNPPSYSPHPLGVWQGAAMDVHALRLFQQIVELGSLSRAAEALRVSQPALSRHLAALERDLGARLLVRHARGVTVTEAGALLLERGRTILREVDEAREEVRALAEEPFGTVAVAFPVSILHVLGGAVVERYSRSFPKVKLRVYEGTSSSLEELMLSERVDVAILISAQRALRNADLVPLVAEPLCVVGPPGSDLATGPSVRIEQLIGVPMILFGEANHLSWRLARALERHGAKPQVAAEVESLALILELVRLGLGHALLPRCAVQEEAAAGRVSAVPLQGMNVVWTLATNRRRRASPSVRLLERLIQEAASERIERGEWASGRPVGRAPRRRAE